MLTSPRALLLDFGGVIVDAPSMAPASDELVRRLSAILDGAVPPEQIARGLTEGARAYAAWRDRVGADDAPAELTHAEVWQDFIAYHWPAEVHDAVRRQATALSYAWTYRPAWALRPGIAELLDAAAERGLPVAVVSNTLCGAAHRDFLDHAGIAGRFAVQLYSDEVGIRKPNPEMARRAARSVGVPVEEAWFVGDSPARDIACARRAGVGAAILMRSRRTDREAAVPGAAVPDAVVDDGYGVLDLLTAPAGGTTGGIR